MNIRHFFFVSFSVLAAFSAAPAQNTPGILAPAASNTP